MPSRRPVTEYAPVVNHSVTPMYHGPGCMLEICVLEKHEKSCELWRRPGRYDESVDGYNIIFRQNLRTCGDDITPPKVEILKCVCDETTTSGFASCPVCSQCPCHSKKPIVLHIPPSEILSSLPEEYIESTDTKNDYIADTEIPIFLQGLPDNDSIESRTSKISSIHDFPDLRSLPINSEEKKQSYFIRLFSRKRKPKLKDSGNS